MSAKSWKEEFYPVEASKLAEDVCLRKSDELSLLRHSLKKWEGFNESNLARHDLALDIDYDVAGNHEFVNKTGDAVILLDIDDSTCALCQYYRDTCSGCPLYEDAGHSCDAEGSYLPEPGPFVAWEETGDPHPMINALKQALNNRTKEVENETDTKST